MSNLETLQQLADITVDTLQHAPRNMVNTLNTTIHQASNVDYNTFLDRFRDKFESLNEEVQRQIVDNLQQLDLSTATTGVSVELQQLRDSVMHQEFTVQKKIEYVHSGFQDGLITGLHRVGDVMVEATDAVLPQRYRERIPRSAKITLAVGTGIAAGYLLYKGMKWLMGWGKKSAKEGKVAAEKSGGSWWKKLFVGAGVGLLAFFGIKKGYDYIQKHGGLFALLAGSKNPHERTWVQWVQESLGFRDSHSEDDEEVHETAQENTGVTVTDVATAGAGAVSGAASKFVESSVNQFDALRHIPQMAFSLLASGDFEALAEHGWCFIQKEGRWFFETLRESYALPAEFFQKCFTSNLEEQFSVWEGAWVYGETGVAYVLGKGVVNMILTGKAKLPRTLRSIAMMGTRSLAWPGMMILDGSKVVRMILDDDGRIIIKHTLFRWGPAGFWMDSKIHKALNAHNAVQLESALKDGVQHFQNFRKVIGAMDRELDGFGKGLVKQESIVSIRKASEKLANKLSQSAVRFSQMSDLPLPKWIETLVDASRLSDSPGIVARVDDAGKILKEMTSSSSAQSATTATSSRTTSTVATATDEVSTAARSESFVHSKAPSSVDTSIDDAAESAMKARGKRVLDRVATARKVGDRQALLRIAENADEMKVLSTVSPRHARALRWMQRSGVLRSVISTAGLNAAFGGMLYTLLEYEKGETQNVELRDEITHEQHAVLRESLGSELGLVVSSQGARFAALHSGRVLGGTAAGVGTAATFAALPLFIGVGVYTDQLRSLQREWVKNHTDHMREHDPASLWKSIEDHIVQRDRGYLSDVWNFYSDLTVRGNREKAEHNVRSEMYKGYFLQMMENVPQLQDETSAQYASRIMMRAQSSVRYLEKITQGKLDEVQSQSLHRAEAYSVLSEMHSRGISQIEYVWNGENKYLDLTVFKEADSSATELERRNKEAERSWNIEQLITQYMNEYKPSSDMIQWKIYTTAPEVLQESYIAHMRSEIVHMVNHEIIVLENRIREAKLSGQGRDMVRYKKYKEISHKVDSLVSSLDSSSGYVSAENMRDRLNELRSIVSVSDIPTEYSLALEELGLSSKRGRASSRHKKEVLARLEHEIGVSLEQSLLSLVVPEEYRG